MDQDNNGLGAHIPFWLIESPSKMNGSASKCLCPLVEHNSYWNLIPDKPKYSKAAWIGSSFS